jgi:glutaryl-CoA dehydrogenase
MSSPSPGISEALQALPEADGDFFQIAKTLSKDEDSVRAKVRGFMEEEVQPIINAFWERDEFPFDLVPKLGQLGIAGLPWNDYGCPGRTMTLFGLVMMEMARVDASVAASFAAHSALAMGAIYLCGSEEQKQKWLPDMAALQKVGSFALTEPEVASGASGGLNTTARRRGDGWVLNGQKKWATNSTWSDLTIVWARDIADDQVKGFIVENHCAGFHVERIQHKMALRVVQSGLVTLTDCQVDDSRRLKGAASFRDTAAVLRVSRAIVAWQCAGCAAGAYEHVLRYAQRRVQFGRPIASFQLVQDLLVRMLANVSTMQALCLRLSQLQDKGLMRDEHAALAEGVCIARMRETVGWARELLGANAILLDHDVVRFMADAEALYSCEATRETSLLVVGNAITGFSAFA